MLHIPGVLTDSEVGALRAKLSASDWEDGRATAGHMSTEVKNNRQIGEDAPAAREAGSVVLDALAKSATFASAALAARISPPLFNAYQGGETYGDHIDGALRPFGNSIMRTDLSATLFLSDPSDYEGGDLIIRGREGEHAVKLPAGDLFLYPASTIHRVNPVTRGQRLASVFWVESLVRDHDDRSLLFELDQSIQTLKPQGDPEAILSLTAVYHNLLRRWTKS